MTSICKSCGKEKEIYAKGFCKSCYNMSVTKNNPEAYKKYLERIQEWKIRNPEKVKEYNKIWRDRNPKAKIKYLKSLAKLKENEVCNILKKHAEELKDDPERLSTEFLQSLIGVKCKNKKEK